MTRKIILIISIVALLFFFGLSAGQKEKQSIEDLKSVWSKSKSLDSFDTYLLEFVQWNNHFELDTKGNCNLLSRDNVELYLLVEKDGLISQAEAVNKTGGFNNEVQRTRI